MLLSYPQGLTKENGMKDILAIIIIAVLLAVGRVVGTIAASSEYELKAIEHSCAQRNPVTGDFEWDE